MPAHRKESFRVQGIAGSVRSEPRYPGMMRCYPSVRANPAADKTLLQSVEPLFSDQHMVFVKSGTKRAMHTWQHDMIVNYAKRYGVRPPMNHNWYSGGEQCGRNSLFYRIMASSSRAYF